jgi:hypothetical protein
MQHLWAYMSERQTGASEPCSVVAVTSVGVWTTNASHLSSCYGGLEIIHRDLFYPRI